MDVKEIGMIGIGSMGAMMSMLFNEFGIEVHFHDPSEENVRKLVQHADCADLISKLHRYNDYESLCKALKPPRLFLFSLPHGQPTENTLKALKPHLQKGDVIIDAGNEHWRKTEHRQRELQPDGIHFIGMGVSGGYQSARSGPSCSPGGTEEALTLVMPFLRRVAAKDANGNPCVTEIGRKGSGHFVKMVHNGIEQGMLSALCEAWGIMAKVLGMEQEEIADTFQKWDREGPLRKNFLISIGADILKKKTNDSRSHVLKSIKDKVVQDADSSEGTGYWTLEAAADYHISIPTVAAAHNFRLASAYHNRRAMVKKAFSSVSTTNQQRSERNVGSDKTLLSYLPGAVYLSFLIAFVQGMHLIAKANKLNHWEVNIKSIIQIWRAGCIIQSDYISDLLAKVCSSPDLDDENLPSHQELASEITKYLTPLKAVVLQAVEADAHVPALSSTLEYVKYISSTDLPTQFMEAELDYFGEHMFDLVDEDNLDAKKGMHHHEWKPAKGIYGT